jgi:hypothetical protein
MDKMKNPLGKNVDLRLCLVDSTYDKEVDEWMIDKISDTDSILQISSPSQEEICSKVKLCRKKHIAYISKNDIFVVHRNSNKPIVCLRKV